MPTLVISYARVDRQQVREIVDLLTAAISVDTAVFWDGQLVPGYEWFDQLKKQINRAGKLFVSATGRMVEHFRNKRTAAYFKRRHGVRGLRSSPSAPTRERKRPLFTSTVAKAYVIEEFKHHLLDN